MRFLRDAVITLIIVGVAIGVVVYARLAGGGLSAADAPGRVEQSVAKRLVRLSIPAGAHAQTNSYRGDWHDGADHFGDHCALCHGDDGGGDTEMGGNMYPKVPDLAGPDIQAMSDGDLFYVVQNGVRWTGMPAWKGEHSAEETWKLVSFMRHLPALTGAERAELHSHGSAHTHEHEANER